MIFRCRKIFRFFPGYVFPVAGFYAIFFPLIYIALKIFTPLGRVFTWARSMDDGILYYLMNSFKLNYFDPWVYPPKIKVFFSTTFASPYIYLPIGYVSKIFRIFAPYLHLIIIALVNFIFVLLVYIFFKKYLNPNIQKKTFFLFTLSSGFWGFVYLFILPIVGWGSFFDKSNMIHEFMVIPSYDFYDGTIPITAINRLYYSVPLCLGLISLILYKSEFKHKWQRISFTSLPLAFCIFIYPFLGIAFSLVLLIFFIQSNVVNKINNLKEKTVELILIFLFSCFGLIPWVIQCLVNPDTMTFYSTTVSGRLRLTYLFITLLLGIGFVLIGFYSAIGRKKSMLFLVLTPIFSAICIELVYLNKYGFFIVKLSKLATSLLLSLFIILLCVFLFLLIFTICKRIFTISMKQLFKNEFAFYYLWFAIFSFIAVTPSKLLLGLNSARFSMLIWLPFSVLVANGIEKLKKENLKKVVYSSYILITSFSIIFYFIFCVSFTYKTVYPAYLTKNEMDALDSLKTFEQGNVLSSPEVGYIIPFYSNKFTLLGSPGDTIDFSGKYRDYQYFFYGKNDSNKRIQILDKYNIRYVFWGNNEKFICNDNSIYSFDSLKEKFKVGDVVIFEKK